MKPVKGRSLFHKEISDDKPMHKHGKKIYDMFKDCIVFDEIKRQDQTLPDRNKHSEEEYLMYEEQLEYVNMLKEMREIKYNPKF